MATTRKHPPPKKLTPAQRAKRADADHRIISNAAKRAGEEGNARMAERLGLGNSVTKVTFLPFTVVLKRSRFLSEVFGNPPETDIYIASVRAEDAPRALTFARNEVLKADRKDAAEQVNGVKITIQVQDYTTLAIFEGHPKLMAHGCATGWWN